MGDTFFSLCLKYYNVFKKLELGCEAKDIYFSY